MKITTFIGLLVIALNTMGLATAALDEFKVKFIAALAAREVPAHEINAIVNLMPRDTVTVTTTVTTPADCEPYSYGPPASVNTPESVTETPAAPSSTPSATTTVVVPPASIASSTASTETASETATPTPAVPVTTTPALGSSSVTPPEINTFGTTSVTDVVTTTSATTTQATSTPTGTPATSTTPPAPNVSTNAAATCGFSMGWVDWMVFLGIVYLAGPPGSYVCL